MMKVLGREFYKRETATVARELLGKRLLRRLNERYIGGTIVEVEGYLPYVDQAAHTYIGKTDRNAVVFGPPGVTYVHQIHRYFCLDIVCENEFVPGSVLIRSIVPEDGVEIMAKNRGFPKLPAGSKGISDGPGKLCMALQIDRGLNGVDVSLVASDVVVAEGIDVVASMVNVGPRVGISKSTELPLRFWLDARGF